MNHINALIELAELWEVQAGMDTEPGNAKRRETLRECADAMKMLLGGAKLAASQAEQRTRELEDLLRSACAIADRSGRGTAWDRFGASVRALGLNGVTARTYRALPSDGMGEPITDSRCEYMFWAAGRCDKCGNVHNGKLPGVEPG